MPVKAPPDILVVSEAQFQDDALQIDQVLPIRQCGDFQHFFIPGLEKRLFYNPVPGVDV
ncbi:TPA: hypothetical protein ACT96X_002438 [Legionella pneumophila]|uniref:hypothetical protein n=1 Tax=Legionella pneumophila TaxID=446 RepID=UPI000AC434AA|nr:hypothetical protein [Legionella pneumophila]HBD7102749.1 hypothetical protein [Legionella pneumophila]HCO4739479.1 hypothetical protein [Legionella pneumophila]HEG4430067.1 hypothetical protein [Legionella pneumophila]HEG4433126.1 hypothetical protein [Legionella pneumophila]HEN5654939.1 hypothetical protein [Legionella pneumophila]